jgi:hypothetical protein
VRVCFMGVVCRKAESGRIDSTAGLNRSDCTTRLTYTWTYILPLSIEIQRHALAACASLPCARKRR